MRSVSGEQSNGGRNWHISWHTEAWPVSSWVRRQSKQHLHTLLHTMGISADWRGATQQPSDVHDKYCMLILLSQFSVVPFAPDPAGELQRSTGLLARLKGLLVREGRGRQGEGQESRGRKEWGWGDQRTGWTIFAMPTLRAWHLRPSCWLDCLGVLWIVCIFGKCQLVSWHKRLLSRVLDLFPFLVCSYVSSFLVLLTASFSYDSFACIIQVIGWEFWVFCTSQEIGWEHSLRNGL